MHALIWVPMRHLLHDYCVSGTMLGSGEYRTRTGQILVLKQTSVFDDRLGHFQAPTDAFSYPVTWQRYIFLPYFLLYVKYVGALRITFLLAFLTIPFIEGHSHSHSSSTSGVAIKGKWKEGKFIRMILFCFLPLSYPMNPYYQWHFFCFKMRSSSHTL